MSRTRLAAVFSVAAVVAAAACGGSVRGPSESSGGDAAVFEGGTVGVNLDAASSPDVTIDSSTADGQVDTDADADAGCEGLGCQIPTCAAGASTIVRGRVVDPAGRVPIYNALAYVPAAPDGALPDVPHGAAATPCSCGALVESAHPVASASSGIDGTFVVTAAPAGHDIPLVVQVGAWRREVVVPTVAPCQTIDLGDVRLPQSGSDGAYASLPNIAISTGGGDALECLLTRMGVAASEFTGLPADPTKHVHVFQGTGGHVVAGQTALSSSLTLWNDPSSLAPFDMVLLSCEGGPTMAPDPTALANYVMSGGRVYAEHGHSAFFDDTTAFPDIATWTPGTYGGPTTADVDLSTPHGMPFPGGQALGAWLSAQGATDGGSLAIAQGFYDAVVTGTQVAEPWLSTAPGITPASAQMLSWGVSSGIAVPGGAESCGRVVFSDVHQGSSSPVPVDYTSSPDVPEGCASTLPLSPSELAIEFALFDVDSCVLLPPKGPPPMPDE